MLQTNRLLLSIVCSISPIALSLIVLAQSAMTSSALRLAGKLGWNSASNRFLVDPGTSRVTEIGLDSNMVSVEKHYRIKSKGKT